jgi:hypothetical protein
MPGFFSSMADIVATSQIRTNLRLENHPKCALAQIQQWAAMDDAFQ